MARNLPYFTPRGDLCIGSVRAFNTVRSTHSKRRESNEGRGYLNFLNISRIDSLEGNFGRGALPLLPSVFPLLSDLTLLITPPSVDGPDLGLHH